MGSLGQVLASVLQVFIFVLFARLILDYVFMFARSWTPRGPILLLIEAIFSITDPPLRLVRRFIPPLRIGTVALDLGFLVLLIAAQVLRGFVIVYF